MIAFRYLHRCNRTDEALMLKQRHFRNNNRYSNKRKSVNDPVDTEALTMSVLMTPSYLNETAATRRALNV